MMLLFPRFSMLLPPYFFQLEAEALLPVAGQNLGVLCPPKPNKKIRRQSLEEVERWL